MWAHQSLKFLVLSKCMIEMYGIPGVTPQAIHSIFHLNLFLELVFLPHILHSRDSPFGENEIKAVLGLELKE